MVFVNSMSDLFHEGVPDEWIDRVFAVMALAPQHTFQVLTKRSARMREYMNKACGRIADTIIAFRRDRGRRAADMHLQQRRVRGWRDADGQRQWCADD